jgi:HK97 gp10 family phage protein
MSVTVRLDTRVLDALAKNLDTNTDGALKALAYQVEGQAKSLAPVDTGALKGSIWTDRKRAGLYHVSDGVEYGIYQELGTSRMAAHPFMVPAVEGVAGEVAERFKELFK